MRSPYSLLGAMALAGAILLAADTPTPAAFKMRISTNGGGSFPVQIEDNKAGDTNLAVGTIGASFTLPGGGSVVFTIDSNRTFGVPFARLSQTELAKAGTAPISFGGQVFIIDVTDTDYAAPNGPVVLTSETSATGLSGGNASQASVSFQSWVDDANVEFGMGSFTGGQQGPFVNTNFGGPSAPDTVLTNGTVTNPFSITSRFTVSDVLIPVGGSFQLTGTATLTPVSVVPAPATLVAALSALPLLGVGIRRRWRAGRA
ncbi:MAG: hypothetical protein U0797_27955 [Gemmataceae bacterium]